MPSTKDLNQLDEVHSFLVSLAEQGDVSAVLYTLASVLTQIPALDKPCNDAYFWETVRVNLNNLADTLQREEMRDESLFGDLTEEDWERAELLDDDDALEYRR
jgi:hypothetical protein